MMTGELVTTYWRCGEP